MRASLVIGVLSVLLVAGLSGCSGAGTDTGTVPESAALAPADAVAFVTVVTDESSEQWASAERLLDVIPGARNDLVQGIRDELAADGLSWDRDVGPALGPELVIVVTSGKRPVILTKPESEQALAALVDALDEPVARATIAGWSALAERQSDLDALRQSLTSGTLENDERFADAMVALPGEALVRAWVDTSQLTADLNAVLDQAGASADLGLDSISAAVSAGDDGALLTMGVRTPTDVGGTQYEPTLFAGVPADAVVALSFGGTHGAVDRLQDAVDLDGISAQVEDLTGVSIEGVLEALSGEGALYVREGTSVPEVTFVLAPPDADQAWSTIDRLLRTAADEAGATIEHVTEDGVDVSRLVTDELSVSVARLDDETMMVTTGDHGVATFRADGEKLTDADAFLRAAEKVELGTRTSGFVYVDIDGLVPFIEGLAGPDAVTGETRDALEAIDSFILQADRDGETTRVSGFVRVNGR